VEIMPDKVILNHQKSYLVSFENFHFFQFLAKILVSFENFHFFQFLAKIGHNTGRQK